MPKEEKDDKDDEEVKLKQQLAKARQKKDKKVQLRNWFLEKEKNAENPFKTYDINTDMQYWYNFLYNSLDGTVSINHIYQKQNCIVPDDRYAVVVPCTQYEVPVKVVIKLFNIQAAD